MLLSEVSSMSQPSSLSYNTYEFLELSTACLRPWNFIFSCVPACFDFGPAVAIADAETKVILDADNIHGPRLHPAQSHFPASHPACCFRALHDIWGATAVDSVAIKTTGVKSGRLFHFKLSLLQN